MENRPNRGFIYVLTNPTLQSTLLKIGKTTRSPEERALEISQGTGVATRYLVAYSELVSDCHQVERLVHEKLDKYRFADNREFFLIPLKDAIRIIMEVVGDFPPSAEPLEGRIDNSIFDDKPDSESYPIQFTQSVIKICSNCSRKYQLTLTRYETQVKCPTCGQVETLTITW